CCIACGASATRPRHRRTTKIALRLPHRLTKKKSPEQIEVVHSQDTPIRHLHGLGISDIEVQEILADLDLLVELPRLSIVLAERSAESAGVGVPSGARTVSAWQPAAGGLNQGGGSPDHGRLLDRCPRFAVVVGVRSPDCIFRSLVANGSDDAPGARAHDPWLLKAAQLAAGILGHGGEIAPGLRLVCRLE